MDEQLLKLLWLSLLTIFILLKDLMVPLLKRINGKNNPINLDRFYQGFLDFKKTQEKLNEEIKDDIEKLEGEITELKIRRK